MRGNLQFLDQIIDLTDHSFGFGLFIRVRLDRRSGPLLMGDQRLFMPTAVVADQLIGQADDFGRTAIIVL